MKSLRTLTTSISASATIALINVSTSLAQGSIEQGIDAARGDNMPTDIFVDGGLFTTVVNTLLFIVGAVAVIMIIIGGFRYVISGGDSNNVTAAKNTILYAIIGIVIALLSYAILDFVVNTFSASSSGDTGL